MAATRTSAENGDIKNVRLKEVIDLCLEEIADNA